MGLSVGIAGLPNVGKSTLLNRLYGSRVAIVEPTSGVTRDRVTVPTRIETPDGERWVEITDTGGIGIVDRDDLGEVVEDQVAAALALADLVLFLVDARDGLTPLDREVADRLRGANLPVLMVVNKVEGDRPMWEVEPFRALGISEGPFAISAQNGVGLGPLYDRLFELLPEGRASEPPGVPTMSIAVVGQRNAGKSTLINCLAGEERMIVSEIPGTTRDAVDVRFERDGEVFVAVDTAGLRKKAKIADAIEFYSDARSHKSIRRADVAVLLFDVSHELSSIDKKLARYITDHYKPVVLAGNKWDLVSDYERKEFVKYLRGELPGMDYAPIVFLSAVRGKGVGHLFDTVRKLYEKSAERVTTGALNRVLERAVEARSPSSSGHRVRILYATQAESSPPTFVLFVNDKRLIGKNYVRYLQNRLRDELDLKGVPLRIVLRDRNDEGTPPSTSHHGRTSKQGKESS